MSQENSFNVIIDNSQDNDIIYENQDLIYT